VQDKASSEVEVKKEEKKEVKKEAVKEEKKVEKKVVPTPEQIKQQQQAVAAKQQDEELEAIINQRNSLDDNKENLDQQFKQAT
jgi:hypothetical protein